MNAVALLAVLLVATMPRHTLVVRVEGRPARHATDACIFRIRARVVGGGTQTTCLTRIDGVPGPNASMHSSGAMTFALQRGTIRTQVRITQRFGNDGEHARQTVNGSIVGGTGRYHRARGTIVGGGTLIDRAVGLGAVHLRYTLSLR
jgi:hypothetical protein